LVYVIFADPNDYELDPKKPQNPFGLNMMAFTSPEDLMENLPKSTSNISRAMCGGRPLTGSPIFKISTRAIKLP
jgi:hypothetical protein